MAGNRPAAVADRLEIRPNPGAQQAFLETSADIAIGGGGAGGGKSFALLMEPLRHIYVPGFNAVLFRRTMPNHTKAGATWDTSQNLYRPLGGRPMISTYEWRWPGAVRMQFSHLEREDTVMDWHGSQICLEMFDELCEFTSKQFWYMLSRNRSGCGVRPYVRATCNPDPDSWVRDLLAWWIDPETGYAIPERSGVLRWFVRHDGDKLVWGDSRQEVIDQLAGVMDVADILPKSLTFIPSKLDDNPSLLKVDPGYKANLMSLQLVERERLLRGNWKIKAAAGLMFQRAWCPSIKRSALPAHMSFTRGWDLAGTPKTPGNDPDWTIGVLLGRSFDGRTFILHVHRMRDTPRKVRDAIANCAASDPPGTQIWIPQDPGQAGKDQIGSMIAELSGFDARRSPEGGDKPTRFSPFSAQAEAGNVYLVTDEDGNSVLDPEYIVQLEGFPDMKHDDDADATSTAFNSLTRAPSVPYVSPITIGQPRVIPGSTAYTAPYTGRF